MSIPPAPRAARLREMMNDPNPWWHDRLHGLSQLIEIVKPFSVLEIGCCRGHSTELFLMYAEHVTALDPWPAREDDPAYFDNESLKGDEYDEFIQRCTPYQGLEIIRGRSPKDVPNRKFDLIYIDGDHRYKAIFADIEVSHSRCRVLAGHDWNISDVRIAVSEFCERMRKPEPIIFPDTSWMINDPS